MSTIYAVTVDDKTVYHGYLFCKAKEYYNHYRNMKCENCIYSTVHIPVNDIVGDNSVDIPIAKNNCVFFDGRVENPNEAFSTDVSPGDDRPYVRAKCMNYGEFSNCHNVQLETKCI